VIEWNLIMPKENTITEEQVWKILEEVKDPEVPVLSVIDLGIIRDVKITGAETSSTNTDAISIIITPTYSGCPAMSVINMDIRLKLMEKGYRNVKIQEQLSPAWTTDWMTEGGKEKLRAYGIAPPNPKPQFCTPQMFEAEAVACPRCNSFHTEPISQFGSTACKAIYRCLDCLETFDYFKCH
jgi:ring-1,2-phenylacetyl-CoA epoxidase subunit PaaD